MSPESDTETFDHIWRSVSIPTPLFLDENIFTENSSEIARTWGGSEQLRSISEYALELFGNTRYLVVGRELTGKATFFL